MDPDESLDKCRSLLQDLQEDGEIFEGGSGKGVKLILGSGRMIEGFESVISNEFAFLDKIFEGRTLSTISKDDVREYILYRVNDRLARLGVQKVYKYDETSANRIKSWFHPLMAGATSTDFFAQSKDGGNYVAKPTQDFMGVNLKTLDLVLK